MEKVILKSIELENAVSKLRSSVAAMQTAIARGCSVVEAHKHYEDIKERTIRVQQLAGIVRAGSFGVVMDYHLTWD